MNLNVAERNEVTRVQFDLNEYVQLTDEDGNAFTASSVMVEIEPASRGGHVHIYGYGAPEGKVLAFLPLNLRSAFEVIQGLVGHDERVAAWGLRYISDHGEAVL
jgi:hypothetical protein